MSMMMSVMMMVPLFMVVVVVMMLSIFMIMMMFMVFFPMIVMVMMIFLCMIVVMVMIMMPVFIGFFLLTVKDHSHVSSRYPRFLYNIRSVFGLRDPERIEFSEHFLPVLKQLQQSSSEHVSCSSHTQIKI